MMYPQWTQAGVPALNPVDYVNPQVEQLFREAGATYDRAVRKQKYGQIQQIISSDAPYVFLFYQKSWTGLNKRIQGIKPSALGAEWNVSDWYVTQ